MGVSSHAWLPTVVVTFFSRRVKLMLLLRHVAWFEHREEYDWQAGDCTYVEDAISAPIRQETSDNFNADTQVSNAPIQI